MEDKENREILEILMDFHRILVKEFPLNLEPDGSQTNVDTVKMIVTMILQEHQRLQYERQDSETVEFNLMTFLLDKDSKILSYSIGHKDPIVNLADSFEGMSFTDFLTPPSQKLFREQITKLTNPVNLNFSDLKLDLNLKYSESIVMPVTGLLVLLKAPVPIFSLNIIRQQFPVNDYQKVKLRTLPKHYSPKKAQRKVLKIINDQRLLNKLHEYIHKNLNRSLPSWKDIEREVGASRSKLVRDFYKEYNTSVHRYHKELRLEQAIIKIETTSKPFKEIARDLGFSEANFTRYIKSESGLTPSQLRKKSFSE